MNKAQYIDKQLSYEGDTWRILGIGVTREESVYVHLASTTRFRQQRNGKYPRQIATWIPVSILEAIKGSN